MIKGLRSSRRGIPLLIASAVATLTSASCASGGSRQTDGAAKTEQGIEVAIQGFAFQPGRIEISSGATVTWTNRDAILYTVTSGMGQKQGVPGVSQDMPARPSGLFQQEMDGKGSTFSSRFEKPGEFSYFCSIHPGMTGVVVVS
ncbi:MAG: cupredoxin domain-containing protein [Actinomycetota bacterium]